MNEKSTANEFEDRLDALVLPEFNHFHPPTQIDETKLDIPHNLPLADTKFYVPQPIDVIIGEGLAYKMLMVGQIQLTDDLLLQKTQMGWILAGEFSSDNPNLNKLSLTIGTGTESTEKFNQHYYKILGIGPHSNFNAQNL